MKHIPYFTKGQRIAMLVLMAVLAVIVGADCLLQYHATQPVAMSEEARVFQQEAEALRAAAQARQERDVREAIRPPSAEQPAGRYELFAFDPNTADSASLRRLGLSGRVAHNLLRYRAAGGRFAKPEQLAKIYGLTPEKFEELKPYIAIAMAERPDEETRPTHIRPLKKDTVLELNTADTVQLQWIRGIGPVFSRRITEYRERLGGYYSVEQLKEAIGADEEQLAALARHFTVDTTQIRPLKVNMASVDRLRAHPYIDFYTAKAIYEARRNAFQLDSIEQLRGLEDMTEEKMERLRPYLSFEQRAKRNNRNNNH